MTIWSSAGTERGVWRMWIPIDPLPQALTPNERRAKDLLDAGKNEFDISAKLRISYDAARELIYEIRKKEAIMAKLTQEQRAEIFYLARETDKSQREIAEQFGVSQKTISNIIRGFDSVQEMCDTLTAADKPKKMPNTGDNPEFTAAVDAMIAETNAADTEAKPKEKLPEAVYRALLSRINDCDFEIEEREERIAELQAEIEQFKRDRDAIIDWKEPFER